MTLYRKAFKSLSYIGFFLSLGILSLSDVRAEPLAKVGNITITSSDLDVVIQDIGRSLPKRMNGGQRKAYALNYLIDLKLAANRAKQLKLDESREFKKKMEYFRQKALMEAFVDDLSKSASSDQKMKAAYDEAAKKHKPEIEVKASHILVPTEAEAKAALKRVNGGENFAKVAKEISKDPGSPGGSLGWFTKKRMVPPFAERAFKTPVGTISQPVKSRFGWHIIKVEGQRTKGFPKFEQVRAQIKNFLVRKSQAAAIKALRNAVNIEKFNPGK